MAKYFQQLVNTKNTLILANILLVFFLILLNNLKVLPVKSVGDFVFFTILAFAFALYRPGWAFLFFVGTIALENINLAPESIGINIRPYQFIGGLAILAVVIRLIFKRLNFQLPKWNWADGLLVIFAISGFLSALGSEASKLAIKQSVILASFVALYFLVRIFIQSFEDLKKIVPFFLSSSVVVIFYGIWQNVRFAKGLTHFEVMPGRPNGTFAEADWLGIFLVFLLAVIYPLIYYFLVIARERSDRGNLVPINSRLLRFARNDMASYLLLTSCFIPLILTVSRSAWLGAFAVTFIFLFIIFTNLKINPRNWQWKETLKIKLPIIACFIVSVTIVYIFNLTSFQLFNRAQSTGTGLQKITVACKENIQLPKKVDASEELIRYGCRHVNLEEIKMGEARGYFIKEIYRQDPNVNIRKVIYQKSWAEIKKHPVLGIGWGNINNILGKDDRGTGFNSSNIFLEVWLGAGLLGITSFVLFLLFGIIRAVGVFLQENDNVRTIGLFLLLGLVAIIIPNLFNAGILLGFLWLFFAILQIKNN